MSVDSYWLMFAQEVPSDLGIDLTEEQIADLARALEGAHENYSLATGQHVADQNWRAAQNCDIAANSAKKVFAFFAERMATLESNTKIFGVLTDRQRDAMHEMFQAEKFVKIEGRT